MAHTPGAYPRHTFGALANQVCAPPVSSRSQISEKHLFYFINFQRIIVQIIQLLVFNIHEFALCSNTMPFN